MYKEIRAVYFDLGGVYYTEGFRNGLAAIAQKHGVDVAYFQQKATEVIFANGYVRGEAPERVFWDQLAEAAALSVDLYVGREIILSNFKPMPGMRDLTFRIRKQLPVGLLTDQCNWLYELDERDGLLSAFDTVVSSYEEGYTKHDMEIFRIACQRFNLLPEEIAFFDDNSGNVERASDFGLRAFLFEDPWNTEMVLRAEGVEIPPLPQAGVPGSRFEDPGSMDEGPQF